MANLLSTLGISVAADALDTVLIRQGRNIQGIIPDCVVEEHHRDELRVTRHPVEQGTPISDHAFKLPMEVSIRAAWSASNSNDLVADLVSGNSSGALDDLGDNYLKDRYNEILALQDPPQIVTLVTGKRSYSNMILTRIEEVTTKDTEHALILDLTFEEVIMVEVQAATLPPVTRQVNPQKTADPINTGNKQPVPVAGPVAGVGGS